MDVLLVVDLQNDFCPGGALAVPDGDAVVEVINRVQARVPHVVQTQDWHPRGHVSLASSHPGRRPHERIRVPYGEQILWPDHCIPGTWGAAFREDYDASRVELVLRKGFHMGIDSYSAFYENDQATPTGLHGYLTERGLRHVGIVGLAADFCVAWSAYDARRLGYDVTVVVDGTRGIDLDGSLDRAWTTMRDLGVRLVRAGEITG
ncbi:MAG: bifunctional nicotinamidase/pyrazinamidase [Myxococcota bacterium]